MLDVHCCWWAYEIPTLPMHGCIPYFAWMVMIQNGSRAYFGTEERQSLQAGLSQALLMGRDPCAILPVSEL
jgi:hypothetical protein